MAMSTEYAERLANVTTGTGWGYWVVVANKGGWYWVGDPEARPTTPPATLSDTSLPSYPVDTAWDTADAPWPPPNW